MKTFFRIAAVFFAAYMVLNAVAFVIRGGVLHLALTALGAGALAYGSWRLQRDMPPGKDGSRNRDVTGLVLVLAGALVIGLARYTGALAAA